MNIFKKFRRSIFSAHSSTHETNLTDVKQPSVFVGGLGGSGTRVVAELIAALDFSMGEDLNESLDDLTYTLLFKRPSWFVNASPQELSFYLDLYLKVKNKHLLSEQDSKLLTAAYEDMYANGHNVTGDGKGAWATARLDACRSDKSRESTFRSWGWKEPNSFLMAKNILKRCQQTKFVFVMRNGLDMAFSKNRQQLFNWHALFNIADPRNVGDDELPLLMLEYWLAVADEMHTLQETMGRHRVLLLKFEDLFIDTQSSLYKVSNFLNVPKEQFGNVRLEAPSSINRYQQQDLSCFTSAQFDRLAAFGYPITR